jgi:hypothetical protein
VGADRKTSVDFREGVLGMPLVFEEPNLDQPDPNHLHEAHNIRIATTISPTSTWPTPSRSCPLTQAPIAKMGLELQRLPREI